MEKPKTKTGTCEYHLCGRKTKVFLCKYCGRYFCKEHIKPKPVLNLRQVSTTKEPLRSKLEKIWRSEKGHPDYSFTPIFWKQVEEKEKLKTERMWKALDSLKELKEVEEHREPEPEVPEVVESTTLTETSPKHIEKEPKHMETKSVEIPPEFFEKNKETYKPRNRSVKIKNSLVILSVIVISIVLVLSFRNFTIQNFLGKPVNIPEQETQTTTSTTTTTVYDIKNICLSQVNENLNIVRSKLPSETKISIINVKKFMGGENITEWVQIYFSHPGLGGLNCELWSWFYLSCEDYKILKMVSETVSSKRVVGIGVAIKKETVEMGGYYSYVFPVFCDDSGNLMKNSKNFLLTKV